MRHMFALLKQGSTSCLLVIALAFVMAALPAIAIGQEAEQQQLARVSTSNAGVSFQPLQSADGWVLVVTGPNGFSFRQEFWGEAPSFSLSSMGRRSIVDGSYSWEIRPSFILDDRTKSRLAAARESGDPAVMAELEAQLRSSGAISARQDSQSGSFSIVGGGIVSGGATESPSRIADSPSTRDQVILDDLIVDGSLCVGQDCVNGESFGFDTLRLKENNLRIGFVDTSSTASFPTNDWELTANDSSNGGANKFSITDISGGRTPFTVEAGARANALYVDDGGRIGIGTSTPTVRVHARDGNTPTLRLEQDGSSGFQPQTWDVAGNETNFFIRDATNGSTLPFRIRPGAPTSSIDISGAGHIGVGTSSPASQLHVQGTSEDFGTANDVRLYIQNQASTESARELVSLSNNGEARIGFDDSAAGTSWIIANRNDGFIISKNGTGATEFRVFNDGDVTIGGTLTENSSRSTKMDIFPVSTSDILAKVNSLPVYEWSYQRDPASRHVGPMAEDFWSSFGLGDDNKVLAPRDVAAVALAAVQGVYEVVEEDGSVVEDHDVQLQQLEQENTELAQRLAALEGVVDRLLSGDESGAEMANLIILLHQVPGVYPVQ